MTSDLNKIETARACIAWLHNCDVQDAPHLGVSGIAKRNFEEQELYYEHLQTSLYKVR